MGDDLIGGRGQSGSEVPHIAMLLSPRQTLLTRDGDYWTRHEQLHGRSKDDEKFLVACVGTIAMATCVVEDARRVWPHFGLARGHHLGLAQGVAEATRTDDFA